MPRIFCPLLLALTTFAAHGGLVDELAADQRRALDLGEAVVVTRNIEGATWPEIRIYQRVKAPAADIAALFLDYENAPSYIPNLKEVRIVGEPAPQSTDIRYTVKLPVVFTTSYTVRNTYSREGNLYVVRWNLLEAFLARSATGSLRVEPRGNEAIVCYANHVEPLTRLVAGLRGQALAEAKSTIQAIATEAERRAAAGRPAPANAHAW